MYHFNPLSPHGERPLLSTRKGQVCRISIHSPRMGRDPALPSSEITGGENFNPLSPHGERLPEIAEYLGISPISIHSPRMGRDVLTRWVLDTTPISIHSPRMGRDAAALIRPCKSFRFQSTLPAWGETRRLPPSTSGCEISIHSPRMGRDIGPPAFGAGILDFNPLSPHGERLAAHHGRNVRQNFNPLSPHGERLNGKSDALREQLFQSTLPAWGETD